MRAAEAPSKASSASFVTQLTTPLSLLGGLSPARLTPSASSPNYGEKTKGVGQKKYIYFTADGIFLVWTDHKGANGVIGSNLRSLYRCVEPDLVKRWYMDFSKAVWTLENAMLAREEDRLWQMIPI